MESLRLELRHLRGIYGCVNGDRTADSWVCLSAVGRWFSVAGIGFHVYPRHATPAFSRATAVDKLAASIQPVRRAGIE